MSVYLVKGRGWKYDFVMKGSRYTSRHFKTKSEARRAEELRKEELRNPESKTVEAETPTDMAFLDLVNKRLDHVQTYNSARHYEEYVYMAHRWVKMWGHTQCSQITQEILEKFILERSRVSAYTANKEIRYLRATFNFGKKKRLISANPTQGLEFLPVEKKRKYVPSAEDIERVIAEADREAQGYLLTVRDTMGRISEINRLTWDDVNLRTRTVTLYTRKKKRGASHTKGCAHDRAALSDTRPTIQGKRQK